MRSQQTFSSVLRVQSRFCCAANGGFHIKFINPWCHQECCEKPKMKCLKRRLPAQVIAQKNEVTAKDVHVTDGEVDCETRTRETSTFHYPPKKMLCPIQAPLCSHQYQLTRSHSHEGVNNVAASERASERAPQTHGESMQL